MNKKSLLVKIQPTVLVLFILTASIIMSVSFSLQYYFLKDLALNATQQKSEKISIDTKYKINSLDQSNFDILSIMELSQKINFFPKEGETHELLPLITNLITKNEYIYAIYTANDDGSFFEVIRLDSSEKLRKKYLATKESKWLVIKIYTKNNKKIKVEELLNKDLKVLTHKVLDSNYNPNTRPWFIKANRSDDAIKTEPYMFSNLESFGTTYAKKIKKLNTVIAVDISLKSLNNFLKKELSMGDSEVYLLRENGIIISSATLNKKKNKESTYLNNRNTIFPYYNSLKNRKLNDDKESFDIEIIENRKYYVYYAKLESLFNNNEYLSILLPYDEIMKTYNDKIIFSSFITFFIFLCILPIIWWMTRLLVIPIEQLSNENLKISKLEFDDVKPVVTYIKEVEELSVSLVNLSKSIKKYQSDEIKLMDSFIKIIASAIDAKSKYTGGHCERVPVLSMMIAKEASDNKGVFKDFTINNAQEERELNVAAWLHDCGKVTTPEYVVDKATKLETIYNRIHEIRTRFEVVHRDFKIKSLENIINGANKKEEEIKLTQEYQKLYEEFSLVAKANLGSEYMEDDLISKIKTISKRTWFRNFDNSIGISRDEKERLNKNTENMTPSIENLLSDKIEHIIPRIKTDMKEYKKYNFKLEAPEHLYNLGEVYNLLTQKGTLTNEERYKINEHIIMSIIMLEELPFLDNMKRVPEYATCHHETLIGTGYPRELTKEQMSLPSRIIAVADVFEALTSSDRPYKEAKTLSESIKILSYMVKDQHLDADIFKMFLESGIYIKYAEKFLSKNQIDEVDISLYV